MTMQRPQNSIHGEWSSRWMFILAATGSAVGLGNIWRFPYLAGENGGGAFVLTYILCVLVMGLPLMMAEILLGRRGRRNPVNTMRLLAEEEGRGRWWQGLGGMGVLAGLMILSFYSVVAGWTIYYAGLSLDGWAVGVSSEELGVLFDGLVGNPLLLLGLHTVFMVMTATVVGMGVHDGLERAVKYMMPLLLVLLLVLAGYAAVVGDLVGALGYLFAPNFGALLAEPTALLAAMGQAFFSLSLGMGAIMAYGSYLPRASSIPNMACWVVAVDTSVAIIAGLAIFPLVFAYGLEPAQGAGLIFKTLPIAFAQMPLGGPFSLLFCTLLVMAAWTSSVSLMEPTAAWLVENHRLSRPWAAAIAGGAAWLLGAICALSFNLWGEFKLFGLNFFGLMDYLTANIMLPLGGVLIAVFVGWRMADASVREELRLTGEVLYATWRGLIRYLVPVAVVLVLLQATGVLRLLGG